MQKSKFHFLKDFSSLLRNIIYKSDMEGWVDLCVGYIPKTDWSIQVVTSQVWNVKRPTIRRCWLRPGLGGRAFITAGSH